MPELMRVANCRLKTASSFSGTRPPRPGRCSSLWATLAFLASMLMGV